ncbi:MAG: XdhC family protein [Actinobacteria bacterium]|nr:XdhC family protein [Actinomycetota bacterium]
MAKAERSGGALRVAVITVSDGVARGVREDASGRAVADLLEGAGFEVVRRAVVADERGEIESLLRGLADDGMPLVVTTGGTGLGPRDITPEATRAVIDREAPGLAEEMRVAGRASTPLAALSRGLVGSRRSTLIVNLPGSERGSKESLSSILPVLPHALELLGGRTVHGPAGSKSATGADSPGGEEDRASATVEDQLVARRAAGEPVVLGTAVGVKGNPPCRLGQKVLLGPESALAGTLGCAEFDDAAVADASGVLQGGAPVTRTYSHDLGSIDVFLEPFLRAPLLLVFSATPVALHVVRWSRELGFDPVLIEDRAERVTAQHREAGVVRKNAEGLAIDGDAMAVHTDHEAPALAGSVAALLQSPVRFIGVMGSARHVGRHLRSLRDRGFSENDLRRVRTPVGLDIGARTAEEIALSILAGLVAARRGARGGWLDR